MKEILKMVNFMEQEYYILKMAIKNIDQILNMIILQGQEYFMIKEEIKKKQRKT